jgi:glycosyltransferase involved in cell wall biosynthesis
MALKNKITIVVPCKNEETYIANLLNSLSQQKGIGQTRIIIADASTDNTREVIQSNKRKLNVEVIEGGPVSIAKNNGAALATTPYILFIDADVQFTNVNMIANAVKYFEENNLDLLGSKIACYDNDIRAKLGFSAFNFINSIMKKKVPFAVGLFMLTRRDKFEELGGFPAKYATSEDFFLSRMYDVNKFDIINEYAGQDSRRLKKMGYFGMVWYLVKNFLNRNNEDYWNSLDSSKYWD